MGLLKLLEANIRSRYIKRLNFKAGTGSYGRAKSGSLSPYSTNLFYLKKARSLQRPCSNKQAINLLHSISHVFARGGGGAFVDVRLYDNRVQGVFFFQVQQPAHHAQFIQRCFPQPAREVDQETGCPTEDRHRNAARRIHDRLCEQRGGLGELAGGTRVLRREGAGKFRPVLSKEGQAEDYLEAPRQDLLKGTIKG